MQTARISAEKCKQSVCVWVRKKKKIEVPQPEKVNLYNWNTNSTTMCHTQCVDVSFFKCINRFVDRCQCNFSKIAIRFQGVRSFIVASYGLVVQLPHGLRQSNTYKHTLQIHAHETLRSVRWQLYTNTISCVMHVYANACACVFISFSCNCTSIARIQLLLLPLHDMHVCVHNVLYTSIVSLPHCCCMSG